MLTAGTRFALWFVT